LNDNIHKATTVLHVIPGLGVGGAEGMLASLVTAKRDRAIHSVVVNLLADDTSGAAIRAAGVPVHDLGVLHAAAMPVAALRLAMLIRRYRPQAIQGWLYYGDLTATWALTLSGLRARTRLYWGIRCSSVDQSQYGAALRLAIRRCVALSTVPDAVVANSFAGRDFHIALGYRPRAFTVIPNGIDTQRFQPGPERRQCARRELGINEDRPVIIHAARVDPMKGHDMLLKMASYFPEALFLSTGKGTEALTAPPNVMALGLRRDMPSLYAAADLALSTSMFGEGFPNVVAEAMACGLPVVATDVGDSAMIVAETGYIVPPSLPEPMAAALRSLIGETGGQKLRRAAAARTRIETQFSLARAVATFDALHADGLCPKP
jgi:glycosyltransferase involved in cell wall biosynthesis